MKVKELGIPLVKEEDVEPGSGEEIYVENVISVKLCDDVSDKMLEVLAELYAQTVSWLKAQGFKNFLFAHPREYYEVDYFVKGNDIIIVDNHQNALIVEVLGEEDANWFIESIKEELGDEALEG